MSNIIELNEKQIWDQHISNKSNPHEVDYLDVKAIQRKATYYPSSTAMDLNTATDSLMLVSYDLTKECPIGGSFVYILQLYYNDPSASARRIQIAFPYTVSTQVNTIAMRTNNADGTWSAWQEIASMLELAKYLPLTGGTVTGGITYKTSVAIPIDIKRSDKTNSDNNFYQDIQFSLNDNIRIGCIRANINSSGNRVMTLGASSAANGAPTGLSVTRAESEDYWYATAPINTAYSTSQIRNISANTSDLTAGSSSLKNGQIHLVYE